MPNPNARLWVETLRSDEFIQGRLYLATQEPGVSIWRHCCLGVACELYVRVHPELSQTRKFLQTVSSAAPAPAWTFTVIKAFGNDTCQLPTQVRDWLGLADQSGTYFSSKQSTTTLVSLNDKSRLSFREIAALIESEPIGLFRTSGAIDGNGC